MCCVAKLFSIRSSRPGNGTNGHEWGGGWPQAVEQPQRESESSALSQAELSVLLNAHSRNSETGVPGLTMN